ncbi:MAG: Yip1 family protein [Candidatus Bathyarchaeota archaeon]|nr:Yip1 family protein [Candidatus Bathyarchaeota archaeon]
MTDKQHTGRLAPIKAWLGGVTEKSLRNALVIILVTAALSAATAYTTVGNIEVPIAGAGDMIKNASAVIAVVGTLLGWVLSTVIYHGGARLLGGKGSLNRMFALSGYASLPILGQQILRFVYYPVLGQPMSTAATTGLDLFFDAFNVFTVVTLILTGVAVMINYGLSGRRSALIALLPTFIVIALGLVTMAMASSAPTQTNGGIFGLRPGG